MSFLQPLGDLFNLIFKEPVYNVLILLYHVSNNFALSIVLLTILIRAALIPLTRKQLQSSRKMQELQPQIKALQAKYRGDPQGLMQAQRELFKENNYSQAQGCLPLLIQMPLLYALFFSFEQLLSHDLNKVNAGIYSFVPHLTSLPHTAFLWMDLAKPDPLHILPVLAGVLTFIQLRMAMPVKPKRQPGQTVDQMAQATQTTMYIMPLITVVFGLNFPAGMALYWCVGTLFMAVQQYFLSGWGSLFVGVPGMERFVPEPRVIPTLATTAPAGARALTPARPGAPARAGATPVAAAPAQPGGFRGMLRQMREQMREQMEASPRQAAEQQAAKNGVVVEGTATVSSDEEKPFAVAREADRQRAARQRPPKQQGPMLVKPAQRAANVASDTDTTSTAGASGEAAPAASDEPGMASAAASPSTSNAGSGGARGGNTAGRAAAGSATQIRPPAAGQRKGSGSGKGAPSSGRPRQNGRPKGGR